MPRLTVTVLVAASACLLVVLFIFSESVSNASLDYAHKAQDYWDKSIKHSPSLQVYNCEDPYRRPGYLYINKDDYKRTRWIPYTEELLDAEIPEYAAYPVPEGRDIFFNVTDVDSEFVESKYTPQPWMNRVVTEDKRRRDASSVETKEQKAADFLGMKDDGDLGWLWGRRILILGDSVDRFMIQFFCEEFGRAMQQPGQHTTASCAIPTFNLTLVHWHFAGSWTSRPDWWWMKDMQDIPFEERYETLWEPTLDTAVRGENGRPDLMMWQNGLWDQRALWEAGEAHYDIEHPLGKRERQLAWQEIRFVVARVKKFVQFIDEKFGAGMPTMFRAITVHRDSNATDANINELDRIGRAVAEQAGHEVFEWARIISAFSMLYKDHTHAGKGAASWLWGNMALEYLARSAGKGDKERAPYFDGWDSCHSYLTNWGGR